MSIVSLVDCMFDCITLPCREDTGLAEVATNVPAWWHVTVVMEPCADLAGSSVVWCGVVWCGVVWCGVVWAEVQLPSEE